MNNYVFDKKQDFENDHKKEKKEKKTSKKEEMPAPLSLLKKNVQSTTPVKVKVDKEDKPKKSKKEKKESKKAEKTVEIEPITLLTPKVAAAEEVQPEPAKPELTPEELKAK